MFFQPERIGNGYLHGHEKSFCEPLIQSVAVMISLSVSTRGRLVAFEAVTNINQYYRLTSQQCYSSIMYFAQMRNSQKCFECFCIARLR